MLKLKKPQNDLSGEIASPIIRFENAEQLETSLAYWQNVLFLNDWIIDAEIVSPSDCKDGDGNLCAGINESIHSLKSSHIKIADMDDKEKSREVSKICHEHILVHELLHCKYAILNPDNNWTEVFYDVREHQLLEEMAKTLIMVKYDLDFAWFRNNKK